jgi:hypothetical protein
MKKIFFLILIILLNINISLPHCQSEHIYDTIRNDTLLIHKQDIINHSKSNLNLNALNLEDNHTVIPNYLVIQLDSNTFSLDTNRESFFETKVFWINNIEDLYYEKNYFYYYPLLPFIEEGFYKFKEGEKNSLTEYFYYLYLFNIANVSKARELNISYLLNSNDILNTEILHEQKIFLKKDKTNIMYVIFRVHFLGIAIFDKINQRNILVPLTSQLFFEPLYYKSGFNKMWGEDEKFFLNYFQISDIKLQIIETQRYITRKSVHFKK